MHYPKKEADYIEIVESKKGVTININPRNKIKKGKVRELLNYLRQARWFNKLRRQLGISWSSILRGLNMAHAKYPTALPMECISTAVEIVRNKEVMERKAQFAHCVWNIQGFLQGHILGTPPDHLMFGDTCPDGDCPCEPIDEEAKKGIVELCQSIEEENISMLDVSETFACGPDGEDCEISPVFILTAVRLVYDLARQLGWL